MQGTMKGERNRREGRGTCGHKEQESEARRDERGYLLDRYAAGHFESWVPLKNSFYTALDRIGSEVTKDDNRAWMLEIRRAPFSRDRIRLRIVRDNGGDKSEGGEGRRRESSSR